MGEASIEQKIRNSSSCCSLNAEQSIQGVLRELKWKAIQGSFYKDQETGKLREADVLAHQFWIRTIGFDSKRVRLRLPVEAKSAKDFHLLFSSNPEGTHFQNNNSYWMGYEDEQKSWVTERLLKLGLDQRTAGRIIKQSIAFSYPKQTMRLWKMLVEPFPIDPIVCSFRETNVGAEKELENSVLWKAALSLRSIIKSLISDAREFHLSYLDSAVEVERSQSRKVEGALRQLRDGVSTLELFHPIAVVDSHLWTVRKGDLRKINWCRFVQQNAFGRAEWWFDVVQSACFGEYAEKLTTYYNNAFKKAKARLRQ